MDNRHRFKAGSVVIEAYPWKHPSGRDYWRAEYRTKDGTRHFITRSTLAKIRKAATDKALEIAKDVVELKALAPETIRRLRRLIDADPTLSFADEFLELRNRKHPQKPVSEAIAEFLALKDANKGRSIQNVKTLRQNLAALQSAHPDTVVAAVTPADIEALLAVEGHSNRTRRNRRASLVTFFRWCRSRGYVPEGATAPEKTEIPIVGDKIPATWTPAELKAMLQVVQPQYLPWLAIAAFAGVRQDEMWPLPGGTKSPLDWSDFKWDRKVIEIRPETAKTKRRRLVPILPALRAWLWSVKKESGPVCVGMPPHKLGRGKGAEAETKRLGAKVGGWRTNALRHSWISYRAAMVGLGQTAMEAGNSESEARRSYNDAKGKDEARKWFALTPENIFQKSA